MGIDFPLFASIIFYTVLSVVCIVAFGFASSHIRLLKRYPVTRNLGMIIEEYHKGKIFVKSSTIDEGTVFKIVLNA